MGTRGVVQKSFLLIVVVILAVAGLASYVQNLGTGEVVRRVINLENNDQVPSQAPQSNLFNPFLLSQSGVTEVEQGNVILPAGFPAQLRQTPRCSEPVSLLPKGGVSLIYNYYDYPNAMGIDGRDIAYLLGFDNMPTNIIYLIDMGLNQKLDRGETPKPVYGANSQSIVYGLRLHQRDLFWIEAIPPTFNNLRLQYCTNRPSASPQCLTSPPQTIVSGTSNSPLGSHLLDVSAQYLTWSVWNLARSNYDFAYCTRLNRDCQRGVYQILPFSQLLSQNERIWQLEITEKNLYVSTGEYLPGNPDMWIRKVYLVELSTQSISTLYDQTSPSGTPRGIHAVPITGLPGVDDILYLEHLVPPDIDVQGIQNGKNVFGPKTLLRDVYEMSAQEGPSQSFEFGYRGIDSNSNYVLGVFTPSGSYTHPVSWLDFNNFNNLHYSNGNFVYTDKNMVPSYISCS